MTFAGIIAGQIGTAFAVRTRRASLRSIGVFSNRYLLGGIAGELALAAVFIHVPSSDGATGWPCIGGFPQRSRVNGGIHRITQRVRACRSRQP